MCTQCVDDLKCQKCLSNQVVRNGRSRNQTQRFLCRRCGSSFQTSFSYTSYKTSDHKIIQLTKEGCGIRSTSRILGISPSTLIRRILRIASNLKRPYPLLFGKSYQVDELFTYVTHKDNRVCVAYSLETTTNAVVDIVVGRRNKTNLRRVISTLLLADATAIVTDKLNIYKDLIPKNIHSTKFRGINRIERQNLSLRTHLKRLNRRTICFSKSLSVLLAVVKIYFWA